MKNKTKALNMFHSLKLFIRSFFLMDLILGRKCADDVKEHVLDRNPLFPEMT